jgi:hypothetical protein
MEPAIQELKEFEISRAVNVQLQARQKKKEQERERNMTTYQTYQPGCATISNQVSSFFVHEGRKAAELESERIKKTSIQDLQKRTLYNYKEDDQSDNSLETLNKGIENFLNSASERGKKHEAFNSQLEEVKRELNNTLPREKTDQKSSVLSDPRQLYNQIDTIHPNKYGGPITNVRQNMFFVQNESQYPSGGRGITGSSMGYGQA